MKTCNASLWKPKGLTGNVELNSGSYFCSGAASGQSALRCGTQMQTLLASSDASSRKIGFGTLFDDLFLAHRPVPVRIDDEAVAGKVDFVP